MQGATKNDCAVIYKTKKMKRLHTSYKLFTESIEERDAKEIAKDNKNRFIKKIVSKLQPFQAKLDNMGPDDFVLAIIHDTSRHTHIIRRLSLVTSKVVPKVEGRRFYTTGSDGGTNWENDMFFNEIGKLTMYDHFCKKWVVMQYKEIVAIVPKTKEEECIKNGYHEL
jgi:hypothetical protein